MGLLKNLLYGKPMVQREPPPMRCMEIHFIRDRKVEGVLRCKYLEGHVCDHTTKDGITWK